MRPIINETISKIPLLSVEEERSLLTAVQEGIPKEKLLEGMDEQALNDLIHGGVFEEISSTRLRPQNNDIEKLIRKVTKKDCDKILSILNDYKKVLDKLAISNIGLVKSFAHKYANNYATIFDKPPEELLDDLTQAGIVGLLIAIKRFNPKDRMDIPKSMFIEADPNGATVLESVIKKKIYIKASPTEVRLNRATGEFIHRPPEMAGKNFNKIWSQSLYSKENRLSAYAVPYIENAMRQLLREETSSQLTDYTYKMRNKLYHAEEKLKVKLDRDPTDEELAEETGMSEEQAHKFRHLFLKDISIDAIEEARRNANVNGNKYEGIDLDGVLTEEAVAPALPQPILLNKANATTLLDTLDSRERRMIEMRFGLKKGEPPKRLGEIAKEFGISKARVCQIEEGMIKKMKNIIKRSELKSAKLSDFSNIGVEESVLYGHLIQVGYLDNNGLIKDKFLKIQNYADMEVDSVYAHLKEKIYFILKKVATRTESIPHAI